MTAEPRPASPVPGLTEEEWQIARKAASKAPRLTAAEMQRLAAILRAAGWGRRPAPGDGGHDAA
jgi:hypothetical protein